MTYEEFITLIKDRIADYVGKEEKVSINHVIKNNGIELDGIVIMNDNKKISPTIYLNEFYDKYNAGVGIDHLVDEIISIHREHDSKLLIDPDIFKDFEKVKHCLAYKIINYEQNLKLLEQIPHKKILDLAIVFYLLLDTKEEQNLTVTVYNNHMNMWKLDVNQLYEMAKANTPNILQHELRNMNQVIGELLRETAGEEEAQAFFERVDEKGMPMYILTNNRKNNGAITILYEDVLKDFSKTIQSDLYILPSSIHEVILIPKSDDIQRDDLATMVRTVNKEEVHMTEILSDNVYVYEREKDLLSIA